MEQLVYLYVRAGGCLLSGHAIPPMQGLWVWSLATGTFTFAS